MEKEIKIQQASLGFITGLERILNYISENNEYSAKIGKTSIRYIGDIENRQVFEIEREK